MNLTTEQKMMLLVLYAMGSSHEGFIGFCKSINGYDEEQIEQTFNSFNDEEVEAMMLHVDSVAGEIASVLKEFYVQYEENRGGK